MLWCIYSGERVDEFHLSGSKLRHWPPGTNSKTFVPSFFARAIRLFFPSGAKFHAVRSPQSLGAPGLPVLETWDSTPLNSPSPKIFLQTVEIFCRELRPLMPHS